MADRGTSGLGEWERQAASWVEQGGASSSSSPSLSQADPEAPFLKTTPASESQEDEKEQEQEQEQKQEQEQDVHKEKEQEAHKDLEEAQHEVSDLAALDVSGSRLSPATAALEGDPDSIVHDGTEVTLDSQPEVDPAGMQQAMQGTFLLPYHRAIVASLVPGSGEEGEGAEDEVPEEDEDNALVVMAPGLGLRRIVSTVLRIYDAPSNLVLLINASTDEEAALDEELTTLGARAPGLRVVDHEMTSARRRQLYLSGGLLSVTSRILVVDMLLGRLPTELVTGLVILHADRVTRGSTEAFIVRLFRDANQEGFVKAFSDEPERLASGFAPLQTVAGLLQLRRVELWPRFHKLVQHSLSAKKVDVVELYQELSPRMARIQAAILECLEATISELRRGSLGSSSVADTFTVDNALFPSFDAAARKHLDPIWHKVGTKTKQLFADLTTLRSLLSYLLQYDAITYYEFLETIVAANSPKAQGTRQNQSAWMLMDAANVIFSEARARVFEGRIAGGKPFLPPGPYASALVSGGRVGKTNRGQQPAQAQAQAAAAAAAPNASNSAERSRHAERSDLPPPPPGETWPSWLPAGMYPTLEEQPKWKLLQDIMREIEQDIQTREVDPYGWTNNTILVMTSSNRSSAHVRKLLSTLHHGTGLVLFPDAEAQAMESSHATEEEIRAEEFSEQHPGRKLMWRQLKAYLWWKANLGSVQRSSESRSGAAPDRDVNVHWGHGQDQPQAQAQAQAPGAGPLAGTTGRMSEALKHKLSSRGAPATKRRRVRKGQSSAASSGATDPASHSEMVTQEADELASFVERAKATVEAGEDGLKDSDDEDVEDGVGDQPSGGGAAAPSVREDLALSSEMLTEDSFDAYFGLLSMENLVVVRTYRSEEDDKVLQELKPRYIVLFDPSVGFIRQIEVYRKMHPALAVRLYFSLYAESFEEQRYLSAIRREKDAFEKLIKDKAGMVVPIGARDGARRRQEEDEGRLLRTIRSRWDGGGGQLSATHVRPRVVVDMREFRSALPAMLYTAGMEVVPTTLTVGDYVLAPELCVERKSLADLVQSFASGRLYTQVEIMCIHYRHPLLLIEFDEDRAFSLAALLEAGGGARPLTGAAASARAGPNDLDVQAKLVLLTLTFPRLQILWSASPTSTADLFGELKATYAEPDARHVAAIGLEGEEEGGGGGGGHGEKEVRDGGGGGGEQAFNLVPHDLLRAMPGISSKNARFVMNQVRNVAELCDLAPAELKEMLGTEAARALHRFLHRDARIEGGRGA